MRQAQWTDGGIAVVDAEPLPLREKWVRLRVVACGICGSDLHILHGQLPFEPAKTPGHEMAGYVESAGAGMPERLYAIEPRSVCGHCGECIAGRRNLCDKARFLGVHELGGMAETVDAPPGTLFPIDPAVPSLPASLAEPLAVCVRGVQLAQLDVDSRVLVLGGGTLGLVTGMLARDRAGEVAVTTRYPHQRELAQRLGLQALDEGEADAWAMENTPDVVVESVGGRADTVNEALRSCRKGGRIVILGVFQGAMSVDIPWILRKELTITGSFTYGSAQRGSDFAAAVAILPRYQSELKLLQTHQFPLSAVADAFAAADTKRNGSVKVTVVPE